jgi:hypothetical protein
VPDRIGFAVSADALFFSLRLNVPSTRSTMTAAFCANPLATGPQNESTARAESLKGKWGDQPATAATATVTAATMQSALAVKSTISNVLNAKSPSIYASLFGRIEYPQRWV